MKLFTYRRRFAIADHRAEARIVAAMDGLHSTLFIDGTPRATDFTPASGPEAIRNHRLATVLDDKGVIEVEAGYRNLLDVGIAVRRDGVLIHESHPGQRLAFPASMARMTMAMPPARADHWQRNRLPLMVDVASGVLFFVVAKLTDLTTAALAGAGVAIILVVLERALKKDLTGGLVLFGVAMSLIAAGMALAFQDDEAIKWRSSAMALIGAAVFLGDGLLRRGRWLGRGLSRYLPFALNHRRMAIGMGLVSLVLAGANLAAMRLLSTDGWLIYHSFLDNIVAMVLVFAVMAWSRERAPTEA